MPGVTEEARLHAVQRYSIVDTPREEFVDPITSLAAQVFKAPVALIMIIDAQRIYIKSSFGTDLQQTNRELGFCASCIQQEKPLLQHDCAELSADDVLRTHPKAHDLLWLGLPKHVDD